jgi:hypothetical protein
MSLETLKDCAPFAFAINRSKILYDLRATIGIQFTNAEKKLSYQYLADKYQWYPVSH